MPLPCTVCTHKNRNEIEAALLAGETLRSLERRHGVSRHALGRHRAKHIPAHLARAKEVREVADAGTLLERLQALNNETAAILREARAGKDKNNELALKAIARVEKQLELEGKLLGELQQEGTVNILLSPEWLELRGVIVLALEPYPEARHAVVRAINAVQH